jgi:hypothetical protein
LNNTQINSSLSLLSKNILFVKGKLYLVIYAKNQVMKECMDFLDFGTTYKWMVSFKL